MVDQDGGHRLWDKLGVFGLCDNDSRVGVLDDLVEETERISELKDEESTSGTKRSETSDHVVGASTHEDTDERIASDTMVAPEIEREAFDLCIELSICVVCGRVDQCESVGRSLDLLAEERVEVEASVEDWHIVEQCQVATSG